MQLTCAVAQSPLRCGQRSSRLAAAGLRFLKQLRPSLMKPELTRSMANNSSTSAQQQEQPVAAQAPEQMQQPQQQQLSVPQHILFDIMDCCVHDPFYTHMAAFFGLSHKDFLALKDPHAWIEFERGELEEEAFYQKLFSDRRPVDGPGLLAHMELHYRYIEGMESLLERLSAAGYRLHAFTNYPSWYRTIDAKLGLSRWLQWSFVSHHTGYRKPAQEAFEHAIKVLGCPADRLLFIDDRQGNVEAAQRAGMQALQFTGSAAALEAQLRARGLEF